MEHLELFQRGRENDGALTGYGLEAVVSAQHETQSWTCPGGAPKARWPTHAGTAGALPAGVVELRAKVNRAI